MEKGTERSIHVDLYDFKVQPQQKKLENAYYQIEQYFIANNIDNNKKVATLLTVVDDETEDKLMVDLCSPEAPEEKPYELLVKIMKNRFSQEPSVMAERHKFQLRKHEKTESVSEYMTALKNLVKTCSCKEAIKENLRNQCVSGCLEKLSKTFCKKGLSCIKVG